MNARDFACRLTEHIIRAWDPDFTKVTLEEAKRIADAEKSGFVSESEINWERIGTES